jgi:hypothetical protein
MLIVSIMCSTQARPRVGIGTIVGHILQDHFVELPIDNCIAKKRVFGLQFHNLLSLIALQAA